MSVTPIPHEATRYFVQSSSRPEIDHVVDTEYQESHEKPHYECGCEARQANEHTKGRECPHIKRVKEYLHEH